MADAKHTPGLAAAAFRAELIKVMPGYDWTVHKSRVAGHLDATGSQSSGSNRLSTLSVVRTELDGTVQYTVKSAGYGLRAKWLHCTTDGTLARALRRLQEHYECTESTYRSHARAMQQGRIAKATGSA
jgi:hypothetical protein